MKKIAVYPGTFDPITLGHLDIIQASAAIFDEVVVGLLINPKKKPMFSEEDRLAMVKESVKEIGLTNVRIKPFHGLTVELVHREKAIVIVRGLRLTTEYEVELDISLNNRILDRDIYTILIAPLQKHIHISSATVRELLSFGKPDLEDYLPSAVLNRVRQKDNPKACS